MAGGSVTAGAGSIAAGASGSTSGALASRVGPGVSITMSVCGWAATACPRRARSACNEPPRLSCATRNIATTPNARTRREMAAAIAAMTARKLGNMAPPPWHRRVLSTRRNRATIAAVAPASDDPAR